MLRMKSSTKMSTLNKLAMAVLIASPLVANAGNLQVKCGQFDIKIYPNAIFLNGNKVDNAHRETESDVMSYVFQEYAEMGGTYTLYSLDVPSRGEMTLSHQWQNADGAALREVKTEKCGAFHSFKGKAPNVKSVLEKQRSGEF